MGVSGVRKTTLMDVLAGRKTSGYIEGDIRVSGFPKKQETFARISSYCEQNDIHSPQVTVRESLIFSAFLRLPEEVCNKEKMIFIDEVMSLVELGHLRDAIVGIPGITGLSTEQRKRLLDRLIKVAEEDNEKFLLKLKERVDRVGLDIPTIEVRYEHLNIEAEVFVGDRALPTFVNSVTNVIEVFLNLLHIVLSRKRHVTILKDVSGIIKPRRLTLLLGPPGSGKTTLLLALSGRLDPSLKVSGRVTYNGHK